MFHMGSVWLLQEIINLFSVIVIVWGYRKNEIQTIYYNSFKKSYLYTHMLNV